MKRFYSPTTGCTYLSGVHSNMPDDVKEISEEIYLSTIGNTPPGKVVVPGHDGMPTLIELAPPPITAKQLCSQIDSSSDAARRAVAGDPLRAVEYDRAATEAQAFKDAGYPADVVPRTVAAWAINGRTAQQAADSILAEAAAYTEALYQIREARLGAKELVRGAMAAGQVEQAQDIAAETIAAIEAAVAGIGNNA